MLRLAPPRAMGHARPMSALPYRGRLAPTPSGWMHLGHARTFGAAASRAQGGSLILRIDDLDRARCRPEFAQALVEDLRWLGISWSEGPDCGGPHGPYLQSDRGPFYRLAWSRLLQGGAIYPSPHSRRDVETALNAPHPGSEDADPVFPVDLRPQEGSWPRPDSPAGVNWRFRVPEGEAVSFVDGRVGRQSFMAGRDFGDFLVWRKDDSASYELATVVDDHAMEVTEVVRGEDLLLSTARQILLYRALGWPPPRFYHAPLLRTPDGKRLAKRSDALSLRRLRELGCSPSDLLRGRDPFVPSRLAPGLLPASAPGSAPPASP